MPKHQCCYRYIESLDNLVRSIDSKCMLICGCPTSVLSLNATPQILFESSGLTSLLKYLIYPYLTVYLNLQNVPPALLVRFLREHRSEWADYGVDAYSAACLKASPYEVPCARPGGFPSSQVILPLAHTVEHEEVTTFSSNLKFFLHHFLLILLYALVLQCKLINAYFT